jgi:hypothetical protein
MAKLNDPSEIEKAIRALVTAERTNLGIEVALPVAYGDGELVSVIIEESDNALSVHDAGFSSMRLSSAGISLTRHVIHRLNELAQRYRCEFLHGRVTARATMESLPQIACLVANAARSVADYAYEVRRQADYDFRNTVFERLHEIVGRRVRQYEEFRGESGRLYRLSVILDATEIHPQNFVSALAHRNAVPQSFAMFYDLSGAYPNVERDAVYDDVSDFRDEDRALLKSVSTQVIGLMEAPFRFKGMFGHA